MSDDRIEALIEASSLGTPEAKRLRASVSDETAARVLARAKEIEQEEAMDSDHREVPTREQNDLVEQIVSVAQEVYSPAGVLYMVSSGNTMIDGRRPCDAIRDGNVADLRVIRDWLNRLADGNF